jgi:hypothetical protein
MFQLKLKIHTGEERRYLDLLGLASLLGEEDRVDVGEDTTLGNGNVSEELVEFLIVSDSELEMTGNDTGLLVVTGSISGQFEDFSSEVLEDGSEVDGSTGTNTLGIVALSQETVDTTNGELESSTSGARLGESLGLVTRFSFATSHFC